MSLSRYGFAITLFLLPTGFDGCPLGSAEVDVSTVCVTRENVEIGAADGGHAAASFTVDDFGEISELANADSNLTFTRIELRHVSGPQLSTVSSARASIASGDPQSSLPTLEVSCAGDCLDGSDIAMPSSLRDNAVDYVLSGSMVVDFEVDGNLPTEPWVADIDVCMSGTFRF